MSAHDDPPAVAHDVDHHEESIPAEPATPMWLPLLGGAIFVACTLLFVATRPGESEATLTAKAHAIAMKRIEAQKAAEAPPAPPPAPMPAAMPAPGAGPGKGG